MYLFPSGVSAFRRNSYDIKYIPVAGTSAEETVEKLQNYKVGN